MEKYGKLSLDYPFNPFLSVEVMLSGDAWEAISEEDWLHTDIGSDNNVQLLKWLHRLTSQCIGDVSKLEQNYV